MPNTHDVPFTSLFFHGIRLRPGTALLHTATTHEVEPPYRAARPLVVRFFRWGIVLGRWHKTGRTETEALLAALKGRDDALTTEYIREHTRRFDEMPNTPEEQTAARKVISERTGDMDEEYEILCALDLL